jgi:hypothetical protein
VGEVYVSGAGFTGLTIDDSGDTYSESITLFDGLINGLPGNPIHWVPATLTTGGVTGLGIFGGSGGNTFTVNNTSNLYWTTALHTGTGKDTVYVHSTTGSLTILNDGGSDQVFIGRTPVAPSNTLQSPAPAPPP